MSTPTFGERFLSRADKYGQLCVGIDPHEELLHAWDLPHTARGLRTFSQICVEAYAEAAALVKIQVAFYEAFGSAGYAVLEETIAALREQGALVLADAKRGDIGSTMRGYARAWLSPESTLCCDAVTASPYLGVESLAPMFDLAREQNAGVFVLGATSNPEAHGLQNAEMPELSRTVSQHVIDSVGALNRATMEDSGARAGGLGIVLGATVHNPPSVDSLGGVVLMPGVGAQGASFEDAIALAPREKHLISPNISRALLRHGPDVTALRTATQEANVELSRALN